MPTGTSFTRHCDCGTRSRTFSKTIFTSYGWDPVSTPPGSGSEDTPVNVQPDTAVPTASAVASARGAR